MLLITGAGGFLGKHLLAQLPADSDIVGLYQGDNVMFSNNKWELDITRNDHMELLKQVKQDFETVIHLAGMVQISLQPNPESPLMAPLPGQEDIAALYVTNVAGTANMLDFCLQKNVKHLIFASSQTIYGMPTNGPFTEESSCEPLEHYAASKICAENILKIGSKKGLAVTILRFPGLYGENRTSGLVYNLCKNALMSGRIKVNVDIPLPLDVIHVNDVVNAFEKSLAYPAKGWNCMNIATGENCSVNLLADSIADLVPDCLIEYSKIPQPIISMDSTKALNILGWKAVPRKERLSHMLSSINLNDCCKLHC